MSDKQGTVNEYISAPRGSEKFGSQVVEHRVMEPTRASTTSLDMLLPELQKPCSTA